MKFLSKVGNGMKGFGTRTGARIKAKSPEILLVCGVVSFVGPVVVACKQTMKAEEILDEHERKMAEVQTCLDMASEEESTVSYTEEQAKKDRFIAWKDTAISFTKLYFPAAVLGVVTITCFGASYGIMKKRNVGLGIAYAAVDKAFKDYRERVRGELGEAADRRFNTGVGYATGKVLEEKEDGSTEIVEKEVETVPFDEDGNEGCRFFFSEDTSKCWQPTKILNDMTLQASRNYMQNKFEIQGFLFLNDVLESLGMEKVPDGQLVGWLKGMGDPYIDYRIQEVYRPSRKNNGTDFEVVYILDFNHCGIIWDKI